MNPFELRKFLGELLFHQLRFALKIQKNKHFIYEKNDNFNII